MNEVFIRIRGTLHYLWCAVDQEGRVLDILVQSRRDKRAAKRLLCKLLRGLQSVPRVIITDKLRGSMPPQNERFCPASNIARAAISIIRPKYRTSPRDSENGKCNGSSQRVTPNLPFGRAGHGGCRRRQII